MMHNTLKVNLPRVRMVAHRGMSGLERENTAAAFVAAGNRSHAGIESDVHRTADGQYIIIHDDDTQRVAGVNLPVEGTDMATLRALRLKDMDGCVREDLMFPTLAEYIRICKKYQKISVLELKNHFEPEDIAAIVEIIRQEGWLQDTIFISFDLPNLISLRELLPQQPAQYLISRITPDLLDILKQHNLDLDIWYAALTEDFVHEVHRIGHQVNVWTVDHPGESQRLAQWGVDYITSNILE